MTTKTEEQLAEALRRVRNEITRETADFGIGTYRDGLGSPGRCYSIKENLLCTIDREIEKLAAHEAAKSEGVSDGQPVVAWISPSYWQLVHARNFFCGDMS